MATSISACTSCLRRTVQVAPRGQVFAEATALLQNNPHRQGPRQYSTTPKTPVTTASLAQSFDAPQTLDVAPLDPSVAQKKREEKLMRNVKYELPYLEDPWKLAQTIETKLARDKYDEAVLLTHQASKNRQVVVAWNHLIDYKLKNQQHKQAIKLYNDMKKRAQLPSVHTYTIIFRGLANSEHPKLAVAEAMKQYNILTNDPRLEPNSTHVNAVLNVCAKAGDLDSMFLVADTLNETTRAPTAYTYTIILNALRHYCSTDDKTMSKEQYKALLDKVIKQAKGLWMEVMQKWTQGKLVIDEYVVCAMGRMLMKSTTLEGKREVLDLIEQTMNVPNLFKNPELSFTPDPEMLNIAVGGASKRVDKSRSVYAVPGRSTLGLVLTALTATKSTKAGVKYWNLMISHYGIVPDRDNWLRMFGMLKMAMNSAQTAAIIGHLPEEYVHEKVYRLAMEVCLRDNLNMNVMTHANKVLDASIQKLKTPDLETMRTYLRTALVSHQEMRRKLREGDAVTAKREYGLQITSALSRLWDAYEMLQRRYFKPQYFMSAAKASGEDQARALYANKREVIALARLMVSAFNKVIFEEMLPEEDLREIRPIGAKINREIQNFFADRDENEPNLPGRARLTKGRGRGEGAQSTIRVDGKEETPEVEEEAPTTSVWGPNYKPAGDFIWDTMSHERTQEEEAKRYAARVRKRAEQGQTPKPNQAASNYSEGHGPKSSQSRGPRSDWKEKKKPKYYRERTANRDELKVQNKLDRVVEKYSGNGQEGSDKIV